MFFSLASKPKSRETFFDKSGHSFFSSSSFFVSFFLRIPGYLFCRLIFRISHLSSAKFTTLDKKKHHFYSDAAG
jgi:hypothetical protein